MIRSNEIAPADVARMHKAQRRRAPCSPPCAPHNTVHSTTTGTAPIRISAVRGGGDVRGERVAVGTHARRLCRVPVHYRSRVCLAVRLHRARKSAPQPARQRPVRTWTFQRHVRTSMFQWPVRPSLIGRKRLLPVAPRLLVRQRQTRFAARVMRQCRDEAVVRETSRASFVF